MASMTWIKIVTSIFDDEKIKLIDSLPDRDAILVIWFKILCQAGKSGCGGALVVANRIPLTDEMLSTVFNRPLNTVRLALKTFQEFGMIEITEERIISVPKWEKYQQVDYLEIKREQDRIRQRRHRDQLKLIGKDDLSRDNHMTVTCDKSQDSHVTVTPCHAPDIDIEKDIDIEVKKDLKDFAPSDFSKCEKSSKPESKSRPSEALSSKESNRPPILAPHQRIQMDRQTVRWTGILPEDIERWKETYPSVDVEQQLREMEVWASAHRSQWKHNWLRFIVHWLSREQDKGGTFRQSNSLERTTPKTFDEIRREKNRQAFETFLSAHKKEESDVVDAK